MADSVTGLHFPPDSRPNPCHSGHAGAVKPARNRTTRVLAVRPDVYMPIEIYEPHAIAPLQNTHSPQNTPYKERLLAFNLLGANRFDQFSSESLRGKAHVLPQGATRRRHAWAADGSAWQGPQITIMKKPGSMNLWLSNSQAERSPLPRRRKE